MSIILVFLNKCASNLLQCSNWVRVQYPWRYLRWVIWERRENTKRIIKVEQAFLIYSNALQKKDKEKKREKEEKRKVRVLILWRYPHWVMWERRGNTKRGPHEKLLYLLQCSKKSMSIPRTFPTVSMLSNTRKAGEYSDKEESTLITERLFWYSEFDLFMLNFHKFCLANYP